MSDKPQFVLDPPIMSWDKPIEEEILYYVRRMKQQWQSHTSVWGSVNKSAKIYANAYETVEKHIIKEMELRELIKADKASRNG